MWRSDSRGAPPCKIWCAPKGRLRRRRRRRLSWLSEPFQIDPAARHLDQSFPLGSGFELSLAPFQRGAQSFLAGEFAELCCDLGLRGIERRDHVDAGLHRVAKAGSVGTAIDGELG